MCISLSPHEPLQGMTPIVQMKEVSCNLVAAVVVTGTWKALSKYMLSK